MKLRRRIILTGSLVAVAGLALSGCAAGGDDDSGPVTILGAFTDAQAEAFQADLDAWGEESGIEVEYSGTTDFQTTVVTRATAGDPPDIAIYPQPGVLLQQVDSLIPLDELIDVEAASADLAEGLAEITEVDGQVYGLPYSINVKSLVWYNPAAFEAAGLEVPTTDDELQALTDQIRDEGLGYPWCAGIESGGATGWGATDWIEEYVLRLGGLDVYNDWITNDVKFSDPEIIEAAEKFEDYILTDGNVNGGGQAVATTSFQTAGNQLFVEGGVGAGQCFMMRQGTFIADFFPDEIKEQIAAGDYTNIDVFPLPTPEGATSAALGGGDLVGAFSDDENTAAVVEYLTSAEFGTNGYADQAIFISPHSTFDASLYPTKFQEVGQQVVADAEIFGFDASDQMPGAVGAGTEWSNLTEWVAGQKTLEEAMQAIDDSWPAS